MNELIVVCDAHGLMDYNFRSCLWYCPTDKRIITDESIRRAFSEGFALTGSISVVKVDLVSYASDNRNDDSRNIPALVAEADNLDNREDGEA